MTADPSAKIFPAFIGVEPSTAPLIFTDHAVWTRADFSHAVEVVTGKLTHILDEWTPPEIRGESTTQSAAKSTRGSGPLSGSAVDSLSGPAVTSLAGSAILYFPYNTLSRLIALHAFHAIDLDLGLGNNNSNNNSNRDNNSNNNNNNGNNRGSNGTGSVPFVTLAHKHLPLTTLARLKELTASLPAPVFLIGGEEDLGKSIGVDITVSPKTLSAWVSEARSAQGRESRREPEQLSSPHFSSPHFLKDENISHPAHGIFTSASTGPAKLVVYSWAAHARAAAASNAALGFSAEKCWLNCLPLTHISGLGIWMRVLQSGGQMMLREDPNFSPQSVLKAITDFPVTHISLVPTQLGALLEERDGMDILRGLDCILMGGSAPPQHLLEMSKTLKIIHSYGMSETLAHVALHDPRKNAPGAYTPLPGKHLRIDKQGEICVRAENLASGYWRNRDKDQGLHGGESTISTISKISTIPTISKISTISFDLDKENYFHTGDLGALDEAGNLYVHGRKAMSVTSGGETFLCAEVEAALKGIWETFGVPMALTHCVVIGLPDHKWGERPVAVVGLKMSDLPLSRTSESSKTSRESLNSQKSQSLQNRQTLQSPQNSAGGRLDPSADERAIFRQSFFRQNFPPPKLWRRELSKVLEPFKHPRSVYLFDEEWEGWKDREEPSLRLHLVEWIRAGKLFPLFEDVDGDTGKEVGKEGGLA